MTRATLVYPVAMRDYMAQLVLPRDLSQEEADRLCAMIQTLAVIWSDGVRAHLEKR